MFAVDRDFRAFARQGAVDEGDLAVDARDAVALVVEGENVYDGVHGFNALTTEAQRHREKRKKIPEPFIAVTLCLCGEKVYPQAARNSCQCAAVCALTVLRASSISLAYADSLKVPRIFWKRR